MDRVEVTTELRSGARGFLVVRDAGFHGRLPIQARLCQKVRVVLDAAEPGGLEMIPAAPAAGEDVGAIRRARRPIRAPVPSTRESGEDESETPWR